MTKLAACLFVVLAGCASRNVSPSSAVHTPMRDLTEEAAIAGRCRMACTDEAVTCATGCGVTGEDDPACEGQCEQRRAACADDCPSATPTFPTRPTP